MKKHALSWLADRLMPKPIITLDPVVHQIGYNAVAEALTTSETLEPASGVTHLQPSTGPEVVKGVVTAAQPGTPEYHLGLMNQMIETLTARIKRAETKRADQRKAYEQDREERAAKQVQSDQDQAAEIAGLVKSLEAYKAAHDVLSVPPPFEECSASGAGHSFNSRGPDGALQCDYCGKAADLPPHVEPPAPPKPRRRTKPATPAS